MEDNKTRKLVVKLQSIEPTGIVVNSKELSMMITDNERLCIQIGECYYIIDDKGFIIDRIIPHEKSNVPVVSESKDFFIYYSEKTNHNLSDDVAIAGARNLNEAITFFKKYYVNANAENVRIIDCNTDGHKEGCIKDIMIVSNYY
jgi:hypothetical protein